MLCRCIRYKYHIVGNFRKVQIFATHDQNMKIRTANELYKFEHMNFCMNTFELVEICTRALCALVSLDLMVVLYHNFKPADDVLPLPREIC